MRVKHTSALWSALLLGLLTLACDDDADEAADAGAPAVSVEAAEATWGEAQAALTATQDELIADVRAAEAAQKSALKAAGDGVVEVDHTFDNPNGEGTARVYGSGSKTGDDWVLSLTIEFTDWAVAESDLVDSFSGALSLTYTISQLVPPAMEIVVTGALDLKMGRFTQTGEVAVTMTLAGTTVTVCGTVVGQPVGEGACP
ncbi:hypothetical protein KKB55_05125 [Myxococcota bacterium]|nr:hypothetical protein [Myxococcota bacterium]MBU1897136.1 hypothetical protein [Myxococcota bacterium]